MLLIIQENWTSLTAAAIATCIFLWIAGFRRLQRRRRVVQAEWRTRADWLLLVTAHPDDESMFFLPLLSAAKDWDWPVSILCLSNGNADGLGKVREKELVKCCTTTLGIPARRVDIVDHPDMQDGFLNRWSHDIVSQLVKSKIDGLTQTLGSRGMVVTFDEGGVSRHPNHIAVYSGVCSLAQSCLHSADSTVSFFALETVGLFCKYSSLFDVFFVSGPLVTCNQSMSLAYRAMACHESQFVWYRKLFVLFSRYVFINSFSRIHPANHSLPKSVH